MFTYRYVSVYVSTYKWGSGPGALRELHCYMAGLRARGPRAWGLPGLPEDFFDENIDFLLIQIFFTK